MYDVHLPCSTQRRHNTQHNDIQHKKLIMLFYYAECHYAGCRNLFIIMLNFIMLSVIMLNVVMLSVIMLNVVMLSVIMLSVVAPYPAIRPYLELKTLPKYILGFLPIDIAVPALMLHTNKLGCLSTTLLSSLI